MAPNQTIRYEKPSDWDHWHKALLVKARSLRLLSYMLGEQVEPSEPTKPSVDDFPFLETSTTSGTRATPATRGTVAGLTPDGRINYQQALSDYQMEQRAFDLFTTRYGTLQDWILETLSETYSNRWCDPLEPVSTWYRLLNAGATSSKHLREKEVLALYKAAIKPLRTAPKNFDQWIGRWEEAMAQATKHKLVEASSTSRWFSDLEEALQDVHLHWVTSYALVNKQQLEDNTVNYQDTVAELRARCCLKSPPAKYTHGSFAAESAGESFEAKDLEEVDDAHATNGGPATRPKPKALNRPKASRPTKRALPETNYNPLAKRIRRPAQSSTPIRTSGQQKCPLCTREHALGVCFYVIQPPHRPGFKPWTPNQTILAMIEEKLEAKPELRNEIDRIKREAAERRVE